MKRHSLLTLVGCILVLAVSLPAGALIARAQPEPVSFRIEFVTGTDGTENALVVELFGPGATEPFWRVTVAENPGDLQPGQRNSYEFPIPATFCDVAEVHVLKPATIPAGDDAWEIREFYVYVDDIEVAFDRVAYETFSPFTTPHWPINLNWQGTEAYRSRCGDLAVAPPSGDLIQVAPGLFSVIRTPVFVPQVPEVRPLPGLFVTPTPTPVPGASMPNQGIACPGFLPSHLQVGGQGRVLPGVANNLRSAPSVNGQLVGQIPGGGVFVVLEGPSCDAAGIAWWRVSYQNLIGWTGEGQGTTYWVEPLP